MARKPRNIDAEIKQLIEGKSRISDSALTGLAEWIEKEKNMRRWRKDAKAWAKKLAKTQPKNDRPPGFEPDDDNSYPIIIDK